MLVRRQRHFASLHQSPDRRPDIITEPGPDRERYDISRPDPHPFAELAAELNSIADQLADADAHRVAYGRAYSQRDADRAAESQSDHLAFAYSFADANRYAVTFPIAHFVSQP